MLRLALLAWKLMHWWLMTFERLGRNILACTALTLSALSSPAYADSIKSFRDSLQAFHCADTEGSVGILIGDVGNGPALLHFASTSDNQTRAILTATNQGWRLETQEYDAFLSLIGDQWRYYSSSQTGQVQYLCLDISSIAGKIVLATLSESETLASMEVIRAREEMNAAWSEALQEERDRRFEADKRADVAEAMAQESRDLVAAYKSALPILNSPSAVEEIESGGFVLTEDAELSVEELRARLTTANTLLEITQQALSKAESEAESKSQSGVEAGKLRRGLAAALAARLAAEVRLEESQREVALYEQMVAALRSQLGNLQALLDDANEREAATQVRLQTLGGQLNTALARLAAEERRRRDLEVQE